MKIKSVKNKDNSDEILLCASLSKEEFKHLEGDLDRIEIFSIDSISIPSNITKTGSRAHCAKWILLPVKVRNNYKINDCDWSQLKCGSFEEGNNVFFIFKVSKSRMF